MFVRGQSHYAEERDILEARGSIVLLGTEPLLAAPRRSSTMAGPSYVQ